MQGGTSVAESIAVVTGASRGIGRAVAVELARRGHRVLATMRNLNASQELVAAAGEKASLIEVAELDVTDPGDFAFPDSTAVLINNAGGTENDLPFEVTPIDEWRRIFELNLFGTVELTRRVIPVLRKRGGGVICNFSSAAILQPSPWYSAYCAAKAAVSSLNDSLRLELTPFGIRVLEIVPALVETDALHDSPVFRAPAASRVAGYETMASANASGFADMRDLVTSPDEAASTIVDSIFDLGGPMRRGCDPVANAALRRWRRSSDEDQYERFSSGNLQ